LAFVLVLGLWLSSGWLDIWVFKYIEEDVPYRMHNGQILGLVNQTHFLFLRHSGGVLSLGRIEDPVQYWFPVGEDGWNVIYYKWPAEDPALPPGWGAGDRHGAAIPPRYQALLQVGPATVGAMRIDDWMLAWLFLLLPITWSVMRLNRAVRAFIRSRAGLCRNCGYGSRASPGRCPECGTVTAR